MRRFWHITTTKGHDMYDIDQLNPPYCELCNGYHAPCPEPHEISILAEIEQRHWTTNEREKRKVTKCGPTAGCIEIHAGSDGMVRRKPTNRS